MKELQIKYDELKGGVENLNATMENIRKEIENCKKEKVNYIDYEIIYNKCKTDKKELERKLNIISDAMNILKGVGI